MIEGLAVSAMEVGWKQPGWSSKKKLEQLQLSLGMTSLLESTMLVSAPVVSPRASGLVPRLTWSIAVELNMLRCQNGCSNPHPSQNSPRSTLLLLGDCTASSRNFGESFDSKSSL